MPRPTCVQCNTNDTLLWRNVENGQICFECHIANTEKDDKTDSTSKSPGPMLQKPPAPGDQSRASILKRPLLTHSAFYKGKYMQVGDIVSMVGFEGGTYYAQIRGFITDHHYETSAIVTWLLPTQASPPPKKGFDPATYIIGPEEAFPHKLNYMKFVMRAPADYYNPNNNIYPLTDYEHNNCTGYIWRSVESMEKIKVLL